MSLDVALVGNGSVVVFEINEHVHFVHEYLQHLQARFERIFSTGGYDDLGGVQFVPVGEIAVNGDGGHILVRLRFRFRCRLFIIRLRIGLGRRIVAGFAAGNGKCGQKGHQDIDLLHVD